MSKTKHILFSSPESAYDLKYSINRWMHPEVEQIDRRKAMKQWTALVNTVIKVGGYAHFFTVPQPDGVFSANAGLVYGRQFVLSSFKYAERRVEEPHWMRWSQNVKVDDRLVFDVIHNFNEPFEGAGDALFVGKVLCCGWGIRSGKKAPDLLRKTLGVPVIPLELVDTRFYHLDTCFCPLDDDTVIYFPGAFKSDVTIKANMKSIEVTEEEALKFACNAVVIDKNVILPAGCDKLMSDLNEHGYECHPLDMSEFIKTGGACKCLTLEFAEI